MIASSSAAAPALTEQHRALPAAVDEPAQPRPADAERDGVGAADRAGGGERAGQVLRVDEQPDAERGERQPGDDRDDEQATSA